MSSFMLLCVGHDPKTVKGQKKGYLTGVLYLAPHKLSGINVCPHASTGCIQLCLNTAGRGRFSKIQEARIKKTRWFHENQESFLIQLWRDIVALKRKAKRMDLIPCVRLNGTSDLPWENIKLWACSPMEAFRNVQFYDYTKVPIRMHRHSKGELPRNYCLTFSRSGNNDHTVQDMIRNKRNVSVVWKGPLPETWMGVPVINGDLSDLRFLDPAGVIVGLKAKGKAKKIASDFVLNSEQEAICKA